MCMCVCIYIHIYIRVCVFWSAPPTPEQQLLMEQVVSRTVTAHIEQQLCCCVCCMEARGVFCCRGAGAWLGTGACGRHRLCEICGTGPAPEHVPGG